MAAFGDAKVRYVGDVAVVEMLGEEKRLNIPFLQKLNAAFDQVLRDGKAKAMITTSSGKFYSNGVDLNWVSQQDYDTSVAFVKLFHDTVARILTFPLPTIAAINGHAFAGGAVLALAHDYRVMQSTRGWFCLNEIHLNLHFSPFLMAMITKKMPGGATLTDAVALGRRYTAVEAMKAGIMQQVCQQVQLENTALQLAQQLLKGAGGGFDKDALELMKKDLYYNELLLLDKSISDTIGRRLKTKSSNL